MSGTLIWGNKVNAHNKYRTKNGHLLQAIFDLFKYMAQQSPLWWDKFTVQYECGSNWIMFTG